MALENPPVLVDFPIKTPVRGFSNHLWFPTTGMWSDFQVLLTTCCACRWLRTSPVSSRFLVNNHCNLSSMYTKFTLSTWLAGKSVEIPFQMERFPWNFRIPSRFVHFEMAVWRSFFPAMLLPPAAPLGSPSSAAAVNSAGRKGWSDPPTKKDQWSFGGFLTWGYPQIIHILDWDIPVSALGYPHFKKTPFQVPKLKVFTCIYHLCLAHLRVLKCPLKG